MLALRFKALHLHHHHHVAAVLLTRSSIHLYTTTTTPQQPQPKNDAEEATSPPQQQTAAVPTPPNNTLKTTTTNETPETTSTVASSAVATPSTPTPTTTAPSSTQSNTVPITQRSPPRNNNNTNNANSIENKTKGKHSMFDTPQKQAWFSRFMDSVKSWNAPQQEIANALQTSSNSSTTPTPTNNTTAVTAEVHNSGLGAVLVVTLPQHQKVLVRPNSIISMSSDVVLKSRWAPSVRDTVQRYFAGGYPLMVEASNRSTAPSHIVIGPQHMADLCVFHVTPSDSLHILPPSLIASCGSVICRCVPHTSFSTVSRDESPIELQSLLLTGHGFVALDAVGGLVHYALQRGEKIALKKSHLVCWTPDVHFEKSAPSSRGILSGSRDMLTAMGPGIVGLYARPPNPTRLQLLKEERAVISAFSQNAANSNSNLSAPTTAATTTTNNNTATAATTASNTPNVRSVTVHHLAPPLHTSLAEERSSVDSRTKST